MENITISQGESFSFSVVFPIDRLPFIEDVVVYVGSKEVARKTDNTLVATADNNIFHVRLSSNFTQNNVGQKNVTIAVDYTDLGVRKLSKENTLLLVIKSNNNHFSNESVATVVSATINIVI